jgi:phenylalanyl-tRNA synthetase beta chain
LSWLRDFAPFDAEVPELAATLDDLGLVVEGIEKPGDGLADVVLARILEITAISGADKIRRVVVATGSDTLEVVCGAWNISVGDLVPLAPVGAVLPGGFAIVQRKMRGVVSSGMLCSGKELGLSEDQGGILILSRKNGDLRVEIDDGVVLEPGLRLVEALGIEADVVFDIAVEANRPDAWCIAGIARDLAARLRLPFAIPRQVPFATGIRGGPHAASATELSQLASVEVADPDLCPRFTSRVFTGVQVGPSPRWLARRLALSGMRPINSVVDASNYVMLELGQPTHPYDLDQVAGGALRIRAARPGESVTTLDGVQRRLAERAVGPGDDCRDAVICDGSDRAIGIAGIMGGASSEIGPETTRVLLESAYFTPMAVARTAKRVGLRTEASARFERGCDPEGIDRAAIRFGDLLGAISGPEGSEAGSIDVRGIVPTATRLLVRTSRVNAVLGTDLNDVQIVGYLEPIGFTCVAEDPGLLDVTVPTFRPDTSREIDVVEEVARHHGYSNLPRRRPVAPQVGALTDYQRARREIRALLAALGAHEAWTSSLLSTEDHSRSGDPAPAVEVANPLTPEESVLRRSLLPGLLKAVAFNVDRREGEVRLFEIGHVFPVPPPERVAAALARGHVSVVDEREILGVVFSDTEDDAWSAVRTWTTLADALGVLGVQVIAAQDNDVPPGMHPTRCAHLEVSPVGATEAVPTGTVVGVVGEVDPGVMDAFGLESGRRRIGWLQVDLGLLLDGVARRSPLVDPVSRFPSSDVDLAFVVPDAVAAGAVEATVRAAAGEILESIELFDVFRGAVVGDGARSIAYRLRLCASDRTLTDHEVAVVRQRCIDAVEGSHGAQLRA